MSVQKLLARPIMVECRLLRRKPAITALESKSQLCIHSIQIADCASTRPNSRSGGCASRLFNATRRDSVTTPMERIIQCRSQPDVSSDARFSVVSSGTSSELSDRLFERSWQGSSGSRRRAGSSRCANMTATDLWGSPIAFTFDIDPANDARHPLSTKSCNRWA